MGLMRKCALFKFGSHPLGDWIPNLSLFLGQPERT